MCRAFDFRHVYKPPDGLERAKEPAEIVYKPPDGLERAKEPAENLLSRFVNAGA